MGAIPVTTRRRYEYLKRLEDDAFAFLAGLVNQDSPSDDPAGVNRVGAQVAVALEDLGFRVERFPQAERGDHLAARIGDGPRRLLLLAHMDTVYPRGTAKARPFRIEDDKAFGPGVADMKGGVAALVFAMRALAAAQALPPAGSAITALFTSDEEVYSPTSQLLIEREAVGAGAVLVMEPARVNGECVVARRGAGRYVLEVRGRAAHAGNQPELGLNAIWDLAQKICVVQALADAFPGATVNVGVVRGGDRATVVPDHAEAEIGVRAWTPESAQAVTEALEGIAKMAHVPGTQANLVGEWGFPPWPEQEATQRLVALLREAAAPLNVSIGTVRAGGASDGTRTWRHAPTLDGLGPAGDRFHSPDEFMWAPSLVERAAIVAGFIERWAAARD
jgi:glutamate carboxypeptidase